MGRPLIRRSIATAERVQPSELRLHAWPNSAELEAVPDLSARLMRPEFMSEFISS